MIKGKQVGCEIIALSFWKKKSVNLVEFAACGSYPRGQQVPQSSLVEELTPPLKEEIISRECVIKS